MGKSMRVKRKKLRYASDLKQRVVNAYVKSAKGIYKLGEEFGIHPKTIYLWLTKAKAKKSPELPPKPFNIMLSISKDGRVLDLKDCASKEEAIAYKAEKEKQGYEVEVSQLSNKTPSVETTADYHNQKWHTPVRCVETGEEFDDIIACEKAMGISRAVIYNSIYKKCAAGGYHFKYVLR